ncbi:glycosyltransferase family 39 protein [Streptomyces sp. TRM68416]|uniref:glycosyltransferase family 39 protein n=1 Tax=Streptomyces sp. TRM68416 TaxID=2758412 RepID=UPI001661A679|nr:glycosyltransferase family 39 protein [Streptomyces sp. TRM68416]MBD0844782.1 glycosyltransferase family 39 protein [Streptomyces sp. TRM68416]
MALTTALGLWGIHRQNSMWGDEAVTWQVAQRGVPHIWRTAQHVDLVHALYYTLMHGVFAVFGDGLLTLRLPSVLAMSLAAAGVGLLGLRLAGPRAGLLAGLVFPLIPQVQRYTQEGRSYAMVCALATWSTVLLLAAASRRTRRWWAGYAVVTLTACLLHEFAVLVLPAHGVTLVVSGVGHRVTRGWARAAGCVVAGTLPLMALSAGQSGQVAWIGFPDPVQLLGLAAMALVGVWCARRLPPDGRGTVPLPALALPILLLPGLLLLLFSPVKPLFVDRYVLYSTIGFALLLSAGLDRARRPRTPAWQAWLAMTTVVAALVPVSVHLRTPESRRDDVFAIGRAVREAAEPGDGLLYLPARRRVWTQARPHDTRNLTDLALAQDTVASDTLSGTELPARDIPARMRAFARIIVVHDREGEPLDMSPEGRAKRRTLDHYFHTCGTTGVHGARITVHVRGKAPCSSFTG